jgi:hypothetical protein
MNAFRKFRMLVLVGLVAALIVGIVGTSADAGCYGYGYGYGHGAFYAPSYSYAPVYSSCYYPTFYAQPYYLNSCYNVYPGSYLP